jgi:hypothetical protein
MTGLSVVEFDRLAATLRPRLQAAYQEQRLNRPARKRAPGAGGRFQLSPRDQTLLTIVWLRRYPINAVLGWLFGVDETTALRTVRRVLPVLEATGLASMRLPDPGKGKRPDLAGLLAALPELAGAEASEPAAVVPDLAVVVDSFEQRVQRPRERAEADTYYSGKKKQHTLKSQVAVDGRDGRLLDVSASVRGPTSDLTLLKDSGLLARVPADLVVGGDLAYVGIGALHPGGITPRRKPRGKPRSEEDRGYNTAFAQRRIIVEHTIGRLRSYQCLTQTDRHHRRDHQRRTRAVAGLVNHRLGC